MEVRRNVSTSALVLCLRKCLFLTHTHRVKEDQHLDAEGMGASLENATESIQTGIRTAFLFGRIISSFAHLISETPSSVTSFGPRLKKKKEKIRGLRLFLFSVCEACRFLASTIHNKQRFLNSSL